MLIDEARARDYFYVSRKSVSAFRFKGVFFSFLHFSHTLESPHTYESAFCLKYIEIEEEEENNDYHDDDDDDDVSIVDGIVVLERCVGLIEEERNDDDAFFKRKESLPKPGVRRQKKRVFT